MKTTMGILIVCLAIGLCISVTPAQQPVPAQQNAAPQKQQTIASVLDQNLSVVEREVVGAAEAMPEDKYNFSPASLNIQGSDYKGVRTFAEQVKHIAQANHNFFGRILSEKPAGDEKGPDALKTKEEILNYLRESFAMGHKAIATITPENAATPLDPSKSGFFNSRLGLADFSCWHSFDHYGQMVEYLRMSGIIPPASRPRTGNN